MDSGVDVMLIDSASPLYPYVPRRVKFYSFKDNIGHLSHGGRDGWGRAFCFGLDAALEQGYDCVAHVEGDSILLPPVSPMLREIHYRGVDAATIPVSSMPAWPETGLMFFSCNWLRRVEFTRRYDWSGRSKYPEPERVIDGFMKGGVVEQLPLRGMRDDFHELTEGNLADRKLDWLTHAPLAVMELHAGIKKKEQESI